MNNNDLKDHIKTYWVPLYEDKNELIKAMKARVKQVGFGDIQKAVRIVNKNFDKWKELEKPINKLDAIFITGMASLWDETANIQPCSLNKDFQDS